APAAVALRLDGLAHAECEHRHLPLAARASVLVDRHPRASDYSHHLRFRPPAVSNRSIRRARGARERSRGSGGTGRAGLLRRLGREAALAEGEERPLAVDGRLDDDLATPEAMQVAERL